MRKSNSKDWRSVWRRVTWTNGYVSYANSHSFFGDCKRILWRPTSNRWWGFCSKLERDVKNKHIHEGKERRTDNKRSSSSIHPIPATISFYWHTRYIIASKLSCSSIDKGTEASVLHLIAKNHLKQTSIQSSLEEAGWFDHLNPDTFVQVLTFLPQVPNEEAIVPSDRNEDPVCIWS